jgi:hypothetical protein
MGWLKNRRRKELLKLFYQNSSACAYLSAFFEQAGLYELADELSAADQEVAEIMKNIDRDGLVGTDGVKRMLEINKMCRRGYESSPGRFIRNFDEHFQPPGGWQSYYNRTL